MTSSRFKVGDKVRYKKPDITSLHKESNGNSVEFLIGYEGARGTIKYRDVNNRHYNVEFSTGHADIMLFPCEMELDVAKINHLPEWL